MWTMQMSLFDIVIFLNCNNFLGERNHLNSFVLRTKFIKELSFILQFWLLENKLITEGSIE